MASEDFIQLDLDKTNDNIHDSQANDSASNDGEKEVSIENDGVHNKDDAQIQVVENGTDKPVLQESLSAVEIKTVLENKITAGISSKLDNDNSQATESDSEDGEKEVIDNDGVGNIDALQIQSVVEIKTILENNGTEGISSKLDNDCSNVLIDSTSEECRTDETRTKRARMTYIDSQPTVHVVYSSLTRESKRKLKDLLQQWSEWQARHEPSGKDSSSETLEYGEETYFPALHVGQEKSSTVAFWLDSHGKQEEDPDSTPIDSDSVPLYDRGFLLDSSTMNDPSNSERLQRLEASRCFNCGSYSHALKECARRRDNVAINNARKQHNAMKNTTASAHGQARYYQNTPGKYDDLKAGFLGAETRECLGIGEHDPPPWLQRMREIGYPPGYLDVKEEEDKPSGITIYADETIMEFEEGELPEKGVAVPPEKKMIVEFPGINAPIPENADRRQWSSTRATDQEMWKTRSTQYEPYGGYNHDNRRSRDHREGIHASENGQITPRHTFSPRYNPYDRNPQPPGVSPNLGFSFTERGVWGTSPHGGSHGHDLQSPQYSQNLHRSSPWRYSPASSFDRWAPEGGEYLPSPDASSQGRDRERDFSNHHRHRRW